jgi:tetratricopeptide (TPR) repeat protein
MKLALYRRPRVTRSRNRELGVRTAVCACLCFISVHSCSGVAFADPDYYQALESADASVGAERFEAAERTIRTALRKYPNDYALTLKLAWIEFQWEHYLEAERVYRRASELSDGSLEARVGLGWSLIQQERCKDGVEVMRSVLTEEPDENAERGISTCAERERLHGAVWGTASGSLYRGHPWLHAAGAGFFALRLQPTRKLEIGGAYRYARLVASDIRVPALTQHEVYLAAGLIGKHMDLLGQGALVWGGDAVVGGSRHVGSTLRLKYLTTMLSELAVDLTGSFYRDLWVIGMAPSATLTLGPLSLTAAISVEQFQHDTLLSASLTPALALGAVSFWISGKYGPEYRAAYLSQFAVFNAADRTLWALLPGARIRASTHWSLFASYALLRLESGDGLPSTLHSVSVGAIYTL